MFIFRGIFLSIGFVLVSESALDEFFNTADEQMSRMALTMPGRESSFSEIYSHYGGRYVFNLHLIEKENKTTNHS